MITHVHDETKLKFEIKKVLINHLKHKDIDNLRKAFEAIDEDNSGTISYMEMK